MDIKDIKAVMIGHAVGDALGVPVEFVSRDDLDKTPVIDMQGFGTYPYPAGSWSDDTSMSLCALDSLAKGRIDYDDIMYKFGEWLVNDKYTPTGEAFDVGNACKNAIIDYHAHKMNYRECGQKSEYSNGNGSLMRINPFVLYLIGNNMSVKANMDIILTASALTHAHERAKIGCGIYAFVLEAIIKAPTKKSVYLGLTKAAKLFENQDEFGHYHRIFENGFETLAEDEIQSSGYVVHTLEAALWCLLTTEDYKSCVLKAVNLGDDTDSVAAVAGGLAGALYGYDSIPEEWLDVLKRKEFIEDMYERAARAWLLHNDISDDKFVSL